MVQPIATTPSLLTPSLASQKLSWGTQLWRGLSIKWITNWKENILGVLAIYNLAYAIFLFFSGYWLTAGIALFTAGFCSATRKDIRDFTNLRSATRDYMGENKRHLFANLEQKELNQKYKTLNEQHEQTNKEQQQITVELKERNRQLNENCLRFQRDLQTFAQQLNDHKRQLNEGKKQLQHLEGENSEYSRLNRQHLVTLQAFDNRSKGLVTELEKMIQEGNEKNRLAARGFLEFLKDLQQEKSAFERLEKIAATNDLTRLKIFADLAKDVQAMNGRQLQTLDDATRRLQENQNKLERTADELQRNQERLQKTTGELEVMKRHVANLEQQTNRLKEQIDRGERVSASLEGSARTVNGAFSWMVPTILSSILGGQKPLDPKPRVAQNA